MGKRSKAPPLHCSRARTRAIWPTRIATAVERYLLTRSTGDFVRFHKSAPPQKSTHPHWCPGELCVWRCIFAPPLKPYYGFVFFQRSPSINPKTPSHFIFAADERPRVRSERYYHPRQRSYLCWPGCDQILPFCSVWGGRAMRMSVSTTIAVIALRSEPS